jgi:ABC-type transport system involved in cytochrome bd biosynthesis fused ATPase/permease subunit
VYRQLTPKAPTTAAITLPLSLVLGLVLTVSVWDAFGVVGVLLGWMLMVIPALAYLLGIPVAYLLARLESALRRQTKPTTTAALDLPVAMDRRSA